eukprot:PLAT6775.1.p2 GENE.PLAT6775.1~~PLAT6775.1.p2  ORF type:complete len:465 (-),score=268.18 PLAT6775.1:165-1559(-)
MAEESPAPTEEVTFVKVDGEDTPALADGQYDAIVLGTGLKECVLSGLLAVRGMKILQLDRNNYYGADTASVNLTNLWKLFRPGEDYPEEELGQNRDWNVDLVPKLIMANGKLVKILLLSGVNNYLQFKSIDGSYVFKDRRIYKVPATAEDGLRSKLMGIFEKRRFRNFVNYVAAWSEEESKTWEGMDPTTTPMSVVFDKYGLDDNTRSFVGHAFALWQDDEYLDRPALSTIKAIILYQQSLFRYGTSPYLYPIYGLGGLAEGFSRLCAIRGGTYILNRDVDRIVYEDDVAVGIVSEGEAARSDFILSSPDYFVDTDKVEPTGRVIRSVCLMRHLPKGVEGTSAQIILPARATGRGCDTYISIVSAAHCVCHKAFCVAIVSTKVETDDPASELAAAFELLGEPTYRFDRVTDTYAPTTDGSDDHVYISHSYDATSHFETTTDDIISLYARITGEPLDLSGDALLE